MYNFKRLRLNPGDQVIEAVPPFGAIKHFALYLGYDDRGIEWMIENQKGNAVALIKARDYFRHVTRIHSIRRFIGSKTAQLRIVKSALAKIGRSYNLFVYNCEHFVTEVITGKRRSRQVLNLLLLFLLGLFLFWIFKKNQTSSNGK